MANYEVQNENGRRRLYGSISDARLIAVGILDRNPRQNYVDIYLWHSEKGRLTDRAYYGKVYRSTSTGTLNYVNENREEWVLNKDGSIRFRIR